MKFFDCSEIQKRIVLAACGLLAGAVFAGAPVELKNAGFHQTDGKGRAVGWSRHPNWHAEKAGHNGSGAIVWECASESEFKIGGPGQEMKLKPGKRYDFSALIKADGIVTQRKSPYQGLTIFVEGYDDKGKWLFGDSARPAVAGTSSDWVKVEGLTREIPDGVAKIYFRAAAKRCVSGRGAVDNMYLAEHDIPAVECVQPHVYRRESTGGPVRFSASINADVRENRLEDYSAMFTYRALGGATKVQGKVVSAAEAVVTLDTSLFAFGTNDVVCTLYLKGKEIGSAAVPFARLATPTPRRVYIDRHLRTIVDGKPFFPLGMIHWGQVTKENIERYAEGPFNCLDTRWRMPREHLDICHAKGLLVTCGVDHGFDQADEGKQWMTERVNALKDHPALLGWFVSDELPLSDLPMLKRRQGWMEELDPDHPTWYAQDVVREARHYLGVADIIGLDPYPIPTKPIGIVHSTECQAVTNTFGAVAKWMIPQAFGWGWLKRRETKGQRAPTQKEMANMGWQSIAGGANGLIFYAYQHLSEPHEDPEDAFEPAWARTKAMAGEFKKYMDVFLSIDAAPKAESSNGDVAVRTWRHNGDTYLLAVNCTTNAQRAVITLSEPVGKVVSADFAPVPEIDGNKVNLTLEPISYLMLRCRCCTAADFQIENEDFRLTVGKDACVKSLVVKATGEECLDPGLARTVPLLTVTQDRPFDNELKLIHPNKRIVYPANRVRREGDLLVFGFAHGLYDATVRVKVAPHYIAFTLEDFPFERKGSYTYLRMDIPRAVSCRFLQLPVRGRKNFGNWLNACWDDRAAVCVAGASPHPDIDHEDRADSKLLYAEALAGIKLRGASAALFAAPGREAFLDAMEEFEQDYGLPRGVKSRRSSIVKEPIFHLSGDYTLARTDEAIAFMRKGGFRLATMSYHNLFKSSASWGLCGDYDWRDDIPNGEADVRAMLEKFHAAGMYVGFHTLHSHIGLKSRYVTPVADPRLNKTRRFTLAAPIPSATNATEITVFESTADVPMFEPCRILQFGGELMSYESCSAEPPYRFFGVKRGVHATRVTAHAYGEIGGILDVSEYGLPMSCYVDQNTDLQDEVAAKLARAYNCGYDYVYLDGSEGVMAPFNYHVANAQYRYWKLLKREPIFGEAAAKTHFGWHMLAGANAFDTFPPEIFKKNLRAYPFRQAPITQQDMTRVDFGWWSFSLPRAPAGGKPGSMGTQADLWEYGVSVATAWDCAASIVMRLDALKAHPRTDDIFATMKRWGDLRRSGKFREEWRDELKDVSREHHLLIDAKGEYDLVRYEQILAGDDAMPVRAFFFEKDGASWVVYWNCTGNAKMWLPLAPEKVSLFDEFAVRPVAISAVEGGCAIPAAARLYLKSTLPRVELEAAFRQSHLLP